MFVRVVEAGSFTAAAKLLELPVSSVSRALSNLERDLGVRLLHRTTRQLTLTDAGQQYFQCMQLVLGEAEDATQAVASYAAAPRGLVRITAPSGFAAPDFAKLMTALVRRYPGLHIDLRLSNRHIDLVAEGVDLAIRGGALKDSTLIARRIAGGERALYAAPEYVGRRGRPRRVEELTRHDCLSFRGRDRKPIWRLTSAAGQTSVAVTAALVSDDMMFLRDAAISGGGIALLPTEVAAPATRTGELVRVLPRYNQVEGGMYLVWPSHKLVPARVVVVREFMIEQLTRLMS